MASITRDEPCCLLFILLFLPVGSLQADDQDTIAAIKKVGGTVRILEKGWKVEFHLCGRSLTDAQLVPVARCYEPEFEANPNH